MGQITGVPIKNDGDLAYGAETNEIVEEHNDTDSRLGFAETSITDLDGRVTILEGNIGARTPVNISTSSSVVFGNIANVDASSGDVIILLPALDSNIGKLIDVRKVDNSSNSVIIDGDGAEQINGSDTIEITNQYDNVSLFSNGTEWIIL